MSPLLDSAIAKLRKALLHEGGERWRNIVTRGEPANPEWPASLPSTPDLRAWYAWERGGDDDPESSDSWRHLAWAIHIYNNGLAANPPLAPSMVPVFEQYVLDTKDESVWRYNRWDALLEGVEGAVGLAALLERAAEEYLARRASPWRRIRIQRLEEREPVDEFPESLAELPVGTTIEHEYTKNGRPLGSLALKRGPNEWFETLYLPEAYSDAEDACFDLLRAELADGTARLITDEGMLAESKHQRKRGENSEFFLSESRVWEQPPMSELLEGLDDAGWLSYDAEVMEGGYTFMRPERVRDVRKLQTALARDRFGEAYWHESFVPFVERKNGDCYYFDVEGIDGPPGSVLELLKQSPHERQVLFASGADFLEWLVEDDVSEEVFSNNIMPWTVTLNLR